MANQPAQKARASKPRVARQGGMKSAPRQQPRVSQGTQNTPSGRTPQQAQPKRRGIHRSGIGGSGKSF